MRIKLAVLEKDANYLGRFAAAFSSRYAEEVELYSFSTAEKALGSLEELKIDVFLADDCFEIDGSLIPHRCGFAYLIEGAEGGVRNGKPVIGKYQKTDLIFKQILSIYADRSESISGEGIMKGESCKTVLFSSPAGGMGTTSIAAACAISYASSGMRVLYLCLETFGSSNVVFQGEGQQNMSDVIYALKNKNINFQAKLLSAVRQDSSGVHFFSAADVALDMMELSSADIIELIQALKESGQYNCLIIDIDFDLEQIQKIISCVDRMIMVSDGSLTASVKTMRALDAMKITDEQSENPILPVVRMIYNRFSSQSGQMLDGIPVDVIGGARKFEGGDQKAIINELSHMAFFSQFLQEV